MLTNQVAFTAEIVALFYSTLYLLTGAHWLALLVFSSGLCFPIAIWFNRQGFLNVARFATIIGGNLIIFLVASVLGRESGTHLLYFATIFAPPLLFSVRELGKIILSFLVTALCLLMLALTQYALLSHMHIPSLALWWVAQTTLPVSMIMAGLFALYFVTASERAAEGLRISESRYRSVVNDVKEVIFRTDRNGRWTLLNPAWVELTGYPVEESLGKPFLDYVLPADHQQILDWLQPLLKGDTSNHRHEVRVVTQKGSVRWVEILVRPTIDDAGQMIGTSGTLDDISERKQAEDEIRLRNRDLALLNRIITAATSVHEPTAVLETLCRELAVAFDATSVGAALLDDTQQSVSVVVEHTTHAAASPLFLGRVIPVVNDNIGQHLMQKKQVLVINDVRQEIGGRISELLQPCELVALLVVPLHVNDRVLGFIGLTDAEPRQFKQDEITLISNAVAAVARVLENAQLAERLEQRVQERTAELVAAKELSEAANRAKSDFLASMSHELRTPLNAVIGFSEILVDEAFGPVNAKQKRYVENILSSGRHLLALINDILDLAKVEAGRMDLNLAYFHVDEMLHNVQTVVQPLAAKKSITLSLQTAANLPLLCADPAKFKQILYNLLSNAIKFTPDGGSVVVNAVGVPGSDGSFSAIQISVADTGIGIALEDQERIFGAFEQVDASYARQQQGTGLGLALTKRFVELHGGRLWVKSAGQDQGSTFTFQIPLHATLPTETPWPTASEPRADNGTQVDNGTAPAILLVEDEPNAAELLRHYLTEAGYAVVQAVDGEEALRLMDQVQPCAIVLDFLLPKKSGWEVLNALKANSATRRIPVVAVTILEDKALGMGLGAAAWLVKPVDRETLINAIRASVRSS